MTKKRECDSAVVELIYAKKALMIVSTHLIRIYPGNFLLEEGRPVVDQEFHGSADCLVYHVAIRMNYKTDLGKKRFEWYN